MFQSLKFGALLAIFLSQTTYQDLDVFLEHECPHWFQFLYNKRHCIPKDIESAATFCANQIWGSCLILIMIYKYYVFYFTHIVLWHLFIEIKKALPQNFSVQNAKSRAIQTLTFVQATNAKTFSTFRIYKFLHILFWLQFFFFNYTEVGVDYV